MASSGSLTRNVGKVTNCVSSLRIVPFTRHCKRVSKFHDVRSSQIVRAAEVESEAPTGSPEPENEFEFNMNDAKKNNEYAASDVEAALRFYFEGGAAPAHNDDFVGNEYGEEDASFFDDIDNNEAYDADEYIAAGIPEAAPKKRRGGRKADGEEEEEDDQFSKGKQLDKFKAMEDQMVMEAALEEEYGSDYDRETDAQIVGSQGVWDWLTDADAAPEAGEELGSKKLATIRRSRIELPSDREVLSAFNTLKMEELDDQTRDLLDLIVGDEVTEDELKTLDFNVSTEDLPESDIFTPEDIARVEGVAGQYLDEPEMEDIALPVPALVADESSVDKDSLTSYLAALKESAAADSELTVDEVKAMFSADGEAVEIDADAEVEDDAEVASIIAADDEVTMGELDLDLDEADELKITVEEEVDQEVKDVKAELRALAFIEEFTEMDLPDAEQLAILDQYISSADDFLQAEEQRKSSAQQMVADGELSADVFAEDLEEVPDLEKEYAEEFAEGFADDEADNAVVYDDDEDGEQWVERIIELNRVTKVVKGGKIMGFRCTAVVGNQNGLVGVGCMAGRDVAVAAKRALVDAKKNIVKVTLVGANTIPHKSEAKYHAARCVLVPASDGTGVIAGGSIKSVLELAGVQNVLAKRIGCRSLLNNARATVKALQQLKSLNEVAQSRGVPMERLLLPKNA
ncbi:hypothetical protein CEUSTIGMA_g3932.t1 [Chlamydomonas eustigma]|uniref:S5 DRBM domain-containing protein n=1 Tax=Chlamydomonas eustigma TaxID=1157962 RepID=A0A250X085_9CHLO|nr:hypothetical protein CEUSTIGMA_g3932.t1 [Chlamydomonas eustigma]|eukprot:GAX76487.1 hypothetical protein CEUSTIGMA_g3932.t1 [Chlamydomonas eustigma]